MKRQKGLRIRPGFYFFYTVSQIGSPTFRHVTCSQCSVLLSRPSVHFLSGKGTVRGHPLRCKQKICVHSAHTNSRTKPGWRGGGGNPDSKRRDPRPAHVPPVSRKLRPDWARRRGVLGTSRFDVRRVGRGLAQSQPPPTPARSGRPAPQAPSESQRPPRCRHGLSQTAAPPARRVLTFLQALQLFHGRPARKLGLRRHRFRPQPTTRQQSVSHFKFPRAASLPSNVMTQPLLIG